MRNDDLPDRHAAQSLLFHGIGRLALACMAGVTLAWPALALVPETPGEVPLITTAIDDFDMLPVHGEISALVGVSKDLGQVPDSMPLPQLTLVLKRSPARQAALDRLVAAQLVRGNPAFRQWVKPDDLMPAFGPAPEDIAQVTGWLAAHGFGVNGVTADGMNIRFSGTAGQIKAAFQTSIHNLLHNKETHFANVTEPKLPKAFAPVVAGITLHNFFPKPMGRSIGLVKQNAASGAWSRTGQSPNFILPTPYNKFQAIGPNDFTKIYDVNPLRSGNNLTGGPLTGLGSTIVLLNDGDAQPKDWDRYRHVFGLSAYKGTLAIEHPGNCGAPGLNLDSDEATLDIELGSMAAPDANVILATCPSMSFNTNSGLFTALENLVSYGTPAQIISVSYGFCEQGYGPTALLAWSQAAQEAAAEGLSVFVATADNGSAGCDDWLTQSVSSLGLAVNGLASNPYVTAVGGTDFADDPMNETSEYFAPHNGPGLETALSYVPEIVWNDTCASPVLWARRVEEGNSTATSQMAFCNSTDGANWLDIVSGAGGRSAVYQKPYWQTLGTQGMPKDGARDLPDVSMFGGGFIWYHFSLFCDTLNGSPACDYHNPNDIFYQGESGTSVATPSLAGIMLLETQYLAEQQGSTTPVRIGNVAPRLYELATAQYASAFGVSACNSSLGNKTSSVCVFHNVTQNTNSVPCAAGTPDCYTNTDSTMGIGLSSANLATGQEAYSAGKGYSLATGLGSVDALSLIIAY